MNYRNRKILDLAKETPLCMGCGKYNDGTVVAAHSDQIRDGKGTAIKASDAMIAFVCFDCHQNLGEGAMLKRDRVELFEVAHRKTMRWLIETERLKVA